MSPQELETALKDLPRFGTLVKDRGYRQVWRFEHRAQPYYLKFYPRQGSRLKRLVRGNPAMREFLRLQWLQRASIPAPHAVGVLIGFRIDNQLGDALVLEAIEPAVPFDQYLNDLRLSAEPLHDHHALAQQLRSLVYQLGRAGFGHADLHLGNFLLREKKLYLLDAQAVSRGGMRLRDLLLLGHSVVRFATLTDLCRGWEQLGPGGAMPQTNFVSKRLWRKFVGRSVHENRFFGRLNLDGWRGVFYKHNKFARRWSALSRIDVSANDWERAWPDLLRRIDNDQLTVLKRTRSGDVLSGEVVLGGRPVSLVIKRPRRRYWHRYFSEIGRGSRPRRAWRKAWNLVVRDVPTAWPALLMEKRVLGYVTDALIAYEHVPGPLLGRIHLDDLDTTARQTLFRRLGRTLRRLETFGFSHRDAKSSNWIISEDAKRGPVPILIDVDGIRHRFGLIAAGIQRLLRSMRDHPQYTPADSLALCQGYAPHARIEAEEQPVAP